MKLTIEQIPEQHIAFIRRVSPYGPENNQVMERLKGWARSKQLMDQNAIIYSIAWDDAAMIVPDKCRYDAGIVLEKDFSALDNEANEMVLKGGGYAVFEVEHTPEAIQKAWIEILPTLEKEKLRIDSTRPFLERYIQSKVDQGFSEICVPII